MSRSSEALVQVNKPTAVVVISVIVTITTVGLTTYQPRYGLLMIAALILTGLLAVCIRHRDAFPALVLLVSVAPLDQLASIDFQSVELKTFLPLVGVYVVTVWLITRTSRRWSLDSSVQLILLALFILTVAISICLSPAFAVDIRIGLTYAQLVLFTFLIVDIVDTRAKYRVLVWVVLISHAFLALHTLVSQAGIEYQGVYRAVGARGDPNFTAQELLVALPFGLMLLRLQASLGKRLLLIAASGLIVGAVLHTVSLGGTLGLGVILLLVVLTPAQNSLVRQLSVSTALIFLAILAGFYLMPPALLTRMSEQFDLLLGVSVGRANPLLLGTSRVAAWNAALKVIAEHPIFGVGPSNLYPNIALNNPLSAFYSSRRFEFASHNMYLALAGEFGVLNLLFFVVLVATSMVRSLVYLRTVPDTESRVGWRLLGYATLIALLAFLAQSFALDAQRSKALWLLLGMTWSYHRISQTAEIRNDSE